MGLRLIARLGGLLGRKGDDELSAKAIWLELPEVCIDAKIFQALRPGGNTGNYVKVGEFNFFYFCVAP